jgi:hypothetical protein
MAESVVRAGLASAIEPLEALGAAITRGIASLVTGPALSSAV